MCSMKHFPEFIANTVLLFFCLEFISNTKDKKTGEIERKNSKNKILILKYDKY